MKRGRQLTMHVEPGDFLIGSLAFQNEAIAAWNTRPQPTPSATGEIVAELRNSGWISGNTGEESDAPYRAATLLEQQAAAISELRGALGLILNGPLGSQAFRRFALRIARATLERTRGSGD
jgi:hypothetical protein